MYLHSSTDARRSVNTFIKPFIFILQKQNHGILLKIKYGSRKEQITR